MNAKVAKVLAVSEELREAGILSTDGLLRAASAAPIAHPLGGPTISGTTMTVDLALKAPTRVTRTLMDLTLQRFFADRVFANAGGITGGAIVYDELTTNQLYLNRDIERVAPGAEFPLVTGERIAPKVAEVEKWGGKFFVTVEARDRNDVSSYTRFIQQLANTIVRKMNQRAVEVLDASITANSRTITGVNWNNVVTTGSSASNATLWPGRDFARATQQADLEELGYVFNLWIMNPAQYFQLATIYGNYLGDLLSSVGYDVFVTNRVLAGTAYVVAEGQAGQLRVEQPLTTEAWYENETQRFWTQSSVRPVMFVDQPFAVLKFTGLAG
jgi:hypothetical protein